MRIEKRFCKCGAPERNCRYPRLLYNGGLLKYTCGYRGCRKTAGCVLTVGRGKCRRMQLRCCMEHGMFFTDPNMYDRIFGRLRVPGSRFAS